MQTLKHVTPSLSKGGAGENVMPHSLDVGCVKRVSADTPAVGLATPIDARSQPPVGQRQKGSTHPTTTPSLSKRGPGGAGENVMPHSLDVGCVKRVSADTPAVGPATPIGEPCQPPVGQRQKGSTHPTSTPLLSKGGADENVMPHSLDVGCVKRVSADTPAVGPATPIGEPCQPPVGQRQKGSTHPTSTPLLSKGGADENVMPHSLDVGCVKRVSADTPAVGPATPIGEPCQPPVGQRQKGSTHPTSTPLLSKGGADENVMPHSLDVGCVKRVSADTPAVGPATPIGEPCQPPVGQRQKGSTHPTSTPLLSKGGAGENVMPHSLDVGCVKRVSADTPAVGPATPIGEPCEPPVGQRQKGSTHPTSTLPLSKGGSGENVMLHPSCESTHSKQTRRGKIFGKGIS